LASADEQTRERVAREGGKARAERIKNLLEKGEEKVGRSKSRRRTTKNKFFLTALAYLYPPLSLYELQ
jgi:hypothetical protein